MGSSTLLILAMCMSIFVLFAVGIAFYVQNSKSLSEPNPTDSTDPTKPTNSTAKSAGTTVMVVKDTGSLPKSYVTIGSSFSGSIITDISFIGDGRMWVVTKGGSIMIGDGSTFTAFMNVNCDTSSEAGLYSIVAHPDFSSNGFYFVKYSTNDGKIAIDRGKMDPKGKTGNAGSLKRVLTIDHLGGKGSYHHWGGPLRFSPKDKMLYIPIGDTESRNAAQNNAALQGKILRISPNVSEDAGYTVPSGNLQGPVLHKGLRNPFNLSFKSDGTMYVENVGSSPPNGQEQIWKFEPNESPKNLGWPNIEATPTTNTPGIKRPMFSWGTKSLGDCICGGTFYTGNQYGPLKNSYVFIGYKEAGACNIYYWNGSGGAKVLMNVPGRVARLACDENTDTIYFGLGTQLCKMKV